jgi:hypothetical protein
MLISFLNNLKKKKMKIIPLPFNLMKLNIKIFFKNSLFFILFEYKRFFMKKINFFFFFGKI